MTIDDITTTPPTFPDEPHRPTLAEQASDRRLQIETERMSESIAAARRGEDRPRPSLRPVLSGRAEELAAPVIKRALRGHQRAVGALTVPDTADPTARIVEAMRAAGEAGEPVDPDGAHVAALVDFHRRRTDADALAAARVEVGRQTSRALTADVRGMRRDLVSAVAADLADLAKLAEQVVEALDGATTAEDAIGKGQAAVSAWQTRDLVRDRTLAAACSLHWVRKRADRGFVVDATGRVDAWPTGNDDRHTSARTWEVVDEILERLDVSDAARALMTGGAK
ncbi:hypothetical protein ACWDPV_17265 [Gordonia sp. NPDC003504]